MLWNELHKTSLSYNRRSLSQIISAWELDGENYALLDSDRVRTQILEVGGVPKCDDCILRSAPVLIAAETEAQQHAAAAYADRQEKAQTQLQGLRTAVGHWVAANESDAIRLLPGVRGWRIGSHFDSGNPDMKYPVTSETPMWLGTDVQIYTGYRSRLTGLKNNHGRRDVEQSDEQRLVRHLRGFRLPTSG